MVVIAAGKREAEVAAARSLKIPVYEYQHGDSTDRDVCYTYSKVMTPLTSVMPFPDKMFLFGVHQQTVFLEGGFWDKRHFEIVGSPQIYFSEKLRPEAYPFDQNFRNILVSSSVLNPIPADLRNFLEVYLKNPTSEKYRFYVRPHPAENAEDWIRFAARFPGRVFYTRDNLHSLIRGAHAHLGVYTSVFQEGFHWNLPVYILEAGPWKMSQPLVDSGGARSIPVNFTGEFEKFEVPKDQRNRLLNLDLKKLEQLLFGPTHS